jgi:hypothetical protein
VRKSRKGNESAPNLYIEFEDEEAAQAPGEPRLVSGRETVGAASRLRAPRWPVPRWPVPRWSPGWAWAALPARGRTLVAGAVVLVGLGAAIGDALAAQAAQRAADRPAVEVLDAAYSLPPEGTGLDLLLDVANTGTAPETVLAAQVLDPSLDLDLRYTGTPLPFARAAQLEIVLSGPWDCAAAEDSGGTASTVRLTVRTIHGTVSTVDLPLPADAQPPGRWRGDRAGLCGWSY